MKEGSVIVVDGRKYMATEVNTNCYMCALHDKDCSVVTDKDGNILNELCSGDTNTTGLHVGFRTEEDYNDTEE